MNFGGVGADATIGLQVNSSGLHAVAGADLTPLFGGKLVVQVNVKPSDTLVNIYNQLLGSKSLGN
jgi:hypothetical protein